SRCRPRAPGSPPGRRARRTSTSCTPSRCAAPTTSPRCRRRLAPSSPPPSAAPDLAGVCPGREASPIRTAPRELHRVLSSTCDRQRRDEPTAARNRSDMSWLVTGGAGYIGAHVVRALADAGMPPVVIDDLSSGHATFVPDGIPFVRGTI